MLLIKKREIKNVVHVRAFLLGAIRLELSTLPPYLTALYSIIPGKNEQIAKILRSIVTEEMLHMCIACNILNAVGGRPTVNVRGFPLHYPSELPMGIGDEPGHKFIVGLEKCSIDSIRDTFMVIEEPEDPLHFPTTTSEGPLAGSLVDFRTIGQFYLAIKEAILKLGNAIFTGDPKLQVSGWFPPDQLFPITNAKSAAEAIDVIIEQGEGTSTMPVDVDGEYAHYYRFAQVVEGRYLVVDPRVPNGFSYSGVKIPFDPGGVYPMIDNPTLVPLPRNSLVARIADQFDETYTCLLNSLQATFSGEPKELDTAIGVMYTLRLLAEQLMTMRIPGRRKNAGPRWRFLVKQKANL
jgi:ferritin-like protein